MNDFIPYGTQCIDDSDIESVVDVLKSSWLTQGPVIKSFESEISKYCKTKHAIAVSNATSALHLCCLALDVGERDIVWTSPITFVSSANCALFCGARVDFVDIDPKTYNMSVAALEEKLISARKQNKLPKVVIPVHFAGQSCDMQKIKELSDNYGFKIIEDASHAIGGEYLNNKIGSCQYSDLSVFSFHPVKIITTGEGGMITTNDDKLAEKITMLRTHGITRDPNLMTNLKDKIQNNGAWYYEQLDLGFNYRITDIQCALGLSQFKKLDKFISMRHDIAKKYNNSFKDLDIVTPYQSPDSHSALHLYPIQVADARERKDVFEHLRANNIGVNVLYIPVYLQPYYQKLGFKEGLCPEAEKYYAKSICLPMHVSLDASKQAYVVENILKIQELVYE
jgi:UDP-4-amino-4,6-dideoxy-N-acetyl-beta-L-altrosamine transaminase